MQIGFVGAGKTGTSIGRYLMEAGFSITGYYSRTKESALESANITKSECYLTLPELVADSDCIFIATPDRAIASIWQEIKKLPVNHKIICHFSGALSSDVFLDMEAAGISGCSIHPMLAFSSKYQSTEHVRHAVFTIEGKEPAVSVVRQMFTDCGNTVYEIASADKIRYHMAAVLVSNDMVALVKSGFDLLSSCDFKQEQIKNLLGPLMKDNLNNILDKGTVAALTGPVERNDTETVKKHLVICEDPDTKKVYRDLGRKQVEIAKLKNPEMDYGEMRSILEDE